jgi:UDP-N-acetyl-2-amino-2-deoxyglucuronate dehydrogenase
LVISPWNLDALQDLEAEYGCRVYNVLQLRLIPTLQELKRVVDADRSDHRADICLTYVTRRGKWYDVSWKGNPEKSGGISMNIGVHFFDLLGWLFGEPEHWEVHLRTPRKMAGVLELERARVRWFLSVDEDDLPESVRQAGKFAYRSMTLDGQEIEFSDGFTDLHTRVYREILAGRGAGLDDARPAIELVFALNNCDTVAHPECYHPFLETTRAFELASYRKVA